MASNRFGPEEATPTKIDFHGGSFIAGPEGQIVMQVRGPLLLGILGSRDRLWRLSLAEQQT